MVRVWPALHDPLRAALDAAVPYPPQLVPAAQPYDAPLLGHWRWPSRPRAQDRRRLGRSGPRRDWQE
ncbi:hypothetical protein [Streptomyces sp. KL116D]|uniref:hypothetical protein n=1 Tax=Streptomyces sp. KL116D TaxID=3045152 RepID=UPI0035572EA1